MMVLRPIRMLCLVYECASIRIRNLSDSFIERFGGSRSGSIYKVVNIEPADYIGCVQSHPWLTPAGDVGWLRSDPRRLSETEKRSISCVARSRIKFSSFAVSRTSYCNILYSIDAVHV